MRVLALDYGSARCGCAVSDPSGTIVTPIAAVERPDTRRGMHALGELVRSREVDRVVVGLPLSLRGTDTRQTLGARVAVELHDERFTTRIAQRMAGTFAAGEDSRAAAILLESWLAERPGERGD
jgi:putative Holliday junction resolvase